MAEVNININGRSFGISCDDGQEQRVLNLGSYVDGRIREIARAGAANNEAHLLVLTALMLSDEVFDLRDDVRALGARVQNQENQEQEEASIVGAIDQLAERIEQIARRIQNA
ncbi:MAG: cell division protein ZapA [Alphaproteobacteria bacterium]|nr:cell division protein ZapA [Alphaproteobacteria bacterium]